MHSGKCVCRGFPVGGFLHGRAAPGRRNRHHFLLGDLPRRGVYPVFTATCSSRAFRRARLRPRLMPPMPAMPAARAARPSPYAIVFTLAPLCPLGCDAGKVCSDSYLCALTPLYG